MFLRYTLPRLVRRSIPQRLFNFMLNRNLLVRPGMETHQPEKAYLNYQEILDEAGIGWESKRVFVLGYGGSFHLGCLILRAGASHIYLCDPYASPNQRYNRGLLPKFEAYLESRDGIVRPNPASLTILQKDVRTLSQRMEIPQVDLILSRAVYEHLDDADAVTEALAKMTRPDGAQLHFINLQDHFFKHPFQMLTYTEVQWRKWLNPPGNLNRYRLTDYQRIFERYFSNVEVRAEKRNLAAFNALRPKIRSEFITGDDQIDSATKIWVLVSTPRKIFSAGSGRNHELK